MTPRTRGPFWQTNVDIGLARRGDPLPEQPLGGFCDGVDEGIVVGEVG